MAKLGCTGEFGCDCPTRRYIREKQNKNLAGHGTRTKYQKGCRCLPCTRANARYSRELRKK